MRIWKLFTLAVIFGIALSACNNDAVVGGGNSAAPSTGNEREIELKSKIIGTWKTHRGSTWTFDADGNFTASSDGSYAYDYNRYAINDTSLILGYHPTNSQYEYTSSSPEFTVYMSPNNKTMILGFTTGTASTYYNSIVLVRQ